MSGNDELHLLAGEESPQDFEPRSSASLPIRRLCPRGRGWRFACGLTGVALCAVALGIGVGPALEEMETKMDADSPVSLDAAPGQDEFLRVVASAIKEEGDIEKEACLDGKYSGNAGMQKLFWSTGTVWRWSPWANGMISTTVKTRDEPHHKSVYRSLPFTVTPATRISLSARGGRGSAESVQGWVADVTGQTTKHGFLGVALWQKATDVWIMSKRKQLSSKDEGEVISFDQEELKGFIGLEVAVDVVDAADHFWGWISVDHFELQGTCSEKKDPEVVMGEAASRAGIGQVCGAKTGHGLKTFFASLGTQWNWEGRFGGGLVNVQDIKHRDWQHPKSVLRSVPFTVTASTSVSVLTRGGRGHRKNVAGGEVHLVGMSLHHGFLGVAVRLVESNRWVLSKRREKEGDDAESDEILTFSSADLKRFVGKDVTLDVVDTFHGWWGWISVREFTLHGPCKGTKTIPVLAGKRVETSTTPKPTSTTPKTTTEGPRQEPCRPKRTTTLPSLYCFSVMSPAEIALVAEQYRRRASIFACNDFNVISSVPMSLGTDECGDEVYTWHNDVHAVPLGNIQIGQATNSFLNTQTFILAWDTLLAGGKTPKHDWIVKVDPDCVFFPNRLRQHLVRYTGQSVFVKNCELFGVKLFGALEAFSEPAIATFNQHREECKEQDWRGWGEDLYMENCLQGHGVASVTDFKEVGDGRCTAAPCTDPSVAAYHPYKDPASWWQCWEASPQ